MSHDELIEKIDKIKKKLNNQEAIDQQLLMGLDIILGKILDNESLTEVDIPVSSANDSLTEIDVPVQSTDGPIQIWSDGACEGNPGPGGWGTIVAIDGVRQEYSGGSKRTTNNIMEMTGALEGIKKTPADAKIVLTSDSQYLIKGMTQWMKNWKKRGWKKADGGDVLNREIWVQLDKEAQKRTIEWIWVKGHAGHPENERCDQLAREAISR